MTDFETFKAMLERAGVGYRAEDFQDVAATDKPGTPATPGSQVIVENDQYTANVSPNVEGWGGFYAVFSFNADGSLAKVGIWE